MSQITTLEQLQQFYKAPHPIVMKKAIQALEPHTITFIEHSRFALVSSRGAEGHLDVSPRGGQAGFIKVLDNQHLVFGDLPGNNRIDTLRNLLHTPEIGILFIIPGINEIVRLRGKATLHDDEELLDLCVESGKRPKIVVKVAVEELFFHCPKAMMVADLWSPEQFTDRDILPSLGKIIKDQLGLDSLE